MKKIFVYLLLGAFLFIASALKAQSLDGVIIGLKAGSAEKITENAGDNMLLTILDKGGTYNKAQALQLMKDFFSKNSAKNFDLKHKGESPNGRFAIGTLVTGNGNYRVNIFMKNDGGKELIKELRFQLIE